MLLSTSEFPVCQMVSMDYKKRYLKTQETPEGLSSKPYEIHRF